MIDWERADALRAEIGDDDFAEVAALFLQECDDAVAGMLASGHAGPDALHFLKGAALNLGFDGLARLCATGEVAGAADPAAIAAAYAAARDAFRSRLAVAG
jgi:HPt (histidine-containing phosphotransfer) domain-containing protein